MKVVIMAGGKGTRISSVASDIPKPMIKIEGKPVLEWEINCLREQGFTDIILTVGHLGQTIMDYFGDGKSLGVHITYYNEGTSLLGNAGALFRIRDQLTEDFLLLNADALFDIDFNRFVAWHKSKGGLVTIFTHPNSHPYDSGLIITKETGEVETWLAKEEQRPKYYANQVNAGLHIISPRILEKYLEQLPETEKPYPTQKIDLDRQILKPLVGTGLMFAYSSSEYVKDMGTPDRLNAVCEDFSRGLVHSRNLLSPQKAIFLDRDGTINKYVGFLTDIEEFTLLPDVENAIKIINASGFLAIVASNQPVIARGEVAVNELKEIHNKMETLLGQSGAYLDGIYVCPHHPDSGFEGEVKQFKIKCDCRKPAPGLLKRASADFNINLAESWMVGDRRTDIEAGKAAGCRTALISECEENIGQDVTGKSLYECVLKIIRKESVWD